jgi:signal transduction histidine kinase
VDEALPVPLTQRLSSRHWAALDIFVAVILANASIVGTAVGDDRGGPHGAVFNTVRYAAIIATCLPLPFRRKFPTAVLAIVTPAAVVTLALGVRGPTILVVVLAIYSVAATSPRRTSLTAAGAVIAAILFGELVAIGGPDWGGMVSTPPIVLVGWLAGENTRTRRAYLEGVADRAAEQERERDERVRRAAVDERLRIARELHDVVAHAMSVIAIRSGVARMVIDTQPDEAREALAIIETTTRRALKEMRLIVGVLRQGESANGELEPAPGLGDISTLLTEVGLAGVPVDLHVDGEQRPLPPGVDVSAYRIVQEALTNVVRHAGKAKVDLAIRYLADELEIEVTDDGGGRYPEPRPTSDGDARGHGLVGMRERVALFGGRLSAGPQAGGFRVVAHFPTDERVR